MGLLLMGGILILLYLIKLIFPNFVVGVAELPSIVKIGTYIDSHLWANLTFTFITSFITIYFFMCACLSQKKLNLLEIIVLSACVLFLICIQGFALEQYQMINDVLMICLPCIFCYIRKIENVRVFYMTAISFSVHSLGQILSLKIRDISTRIQCPNSATFAILLIDLYIWVFLLYCFSNYRKEN